MKLIHAAATTLACVSLSGCALTQPPPSDVEPGSLAESADLSGVEVTVGGKEFTEQLVLCELTALALESTGAKVNRSCGMSGSSTVRDALEGGGIDLYWDYTGTGWLTHLGESELITDPKQLHQRLDAADTDRNKISWLPPASANNTYAVAVADQTAEKLGVSTLSDYAALAQKDPEQASFCGAAEFLGRDDGWPGLEQDYGFDLPNKQVAELAMGAIFKSVDDGKPCVFGEVFATDGRIDALGLTVLEDDRSFFPVYNPAVSVRTKLLEEHPEVAEALAPVAQALDDATLRKLNAEVDVEGHSPELVSEDWLRSKGFVK
ncbi:glycine betaine ABC transporter substrate-binding protein [Nocardioides panzhihuensis]|uniref:Osmoprotectant transport system substrate-binding protein n=1 Tax=Nocardioides panzhihuensis TaxID=860243 RepID=A0A7Z0IRP0_9ACTN|nr:glycine betaine ABC transporter substrate-binding protein [Nocardioides panzhihuensis]NYI77000.1 osmoprotectant transport system substrate-binding protein [Nocardioides panzhihuensis]